MGEMKGGVDHSSLKEPVEVEWSPPRPASTSSAAHSSLVWRGSNLLMAIFFLLAALVQVNDPDPYIWVGVYILPALFTLSITIHPAVSLSTWWRLSVVAHMAVCLSGSIYLTGVLADLLSQNINNPLIHEEGRELAGLIVIISWLWICRFTRLGNSEPGKGSLNALLLVSAILGLMPLAFWGLCFVEDLTDQLSHCKEMFKGGIFSSYTPDKHSS